jgi:hypothetical protein
MSNKLKQDGTRKRADELKYRKVSELLRLEHGASKIAKLTGYSYPYVNRIVERIKAENGVAK